MSADSEPPAAAPPDDVEENEPQEEAVGSDAAEAPTAEGVGRPARLSPPARPTRVQRADSGSPCRTSTMPKSSRPQRCAYRQSTGGERRERFAPLARAAFLTCVALPADRGAVSGRALTVRPHRFRRAAQAGEYDGSQAVDPKLLKVAMEGDDEGETEYPSDAYTAVKVLTGTWNLGAALRRRQAPEPTGLFRPHWLAPPVRPRPLRTAPRAGPVAAGGRCAPGRRCSRVAVMRFDQGSSTPIAAVPCAALGAPDGTAATPFVAAALHAQRQGASLGL